MKAYRVSWNTKVPLIREIEVQRLTTFNVYLKTYERQPRAGESYEYYETLAGAQEAVRIVAVADIQALRERIEEDRAQIEALKKLLAKLEAQS